MRFIHNKKLFDEFQLGLCLSSDSFLFCHKKITYEGCILGVVM